MPKLWGACSHLTVRAGDSETSTYWNAAHCVKSVLSVKSTIQKKQGSCTLYADKILTLKSTTLYTIVMRYNIHMLNYFLQSNIQPTRNKVSSVSFQAFTVGTLCTMICTFPHFKQMCCPYLQHDWIRFWWTLKWLGAGNVLTVPTRKVNSRRTQQ